MVCLGLLGEVLMVLSVDLVFFCNIPFSGFGFGVGVGGLGAGV